MIILICNICVNTNTLRSTTLLICRKPTFVSLIGIPSCFGGGGNDYICLTSLKTWGPKLGIKVCYLFSGCLVMCDHSKKCGAFIFKCLAVHVE